MRVVCRYTIHVCGVYDVCTYMHSRVEDRAGQVFCFYHSLAYSLGSGSITEPGAGYFLASWMVRASPRDSPISASHSIRVTGLGGYSWLFLMYWGLNTDALLLTEHLLTLLSASYIQYSFLAGTEQTLKDP